jgi:hypothetical protein
VDNRDRREPPAGPGSIPRLLRHLGLSGCAPVRHGDWVGVRGVNVGKLPRCVWDQLALHEPRLRRLLRDSPPPGRGRG